MYWFDFDNSPHVPLFRPILSELQKKHIEYFATARDFAQTRELLELWNIPHVMIGKHGGKNKLFKIFNLFQRSNGLLNEIKRWKISLAISHGSRTQLVAAYRRNIPSILMLDYEYTESRIFNTLSSYLLVPEYIPIELLKTLKFNIDKVIQYPGFKEEIYLSDFIPDESFRTKLKIGIDKILVTVRPPSIVGNYHNPAGDNLFGQVLDHVTAHPNVYCLILSRVKQDLSLIPEKIIKRDNIHFLEKPVDGLQLLWNSDLVISGGGTMNREAALMGVPTYSIFKGKKPYLDYLLEQQGRIVFIPDKNSIDKITVQKYLEPKVFKRKKELIVHIVKIFADIRAKVNG